MSDKSSQLATLASNIKQGIDSRLKDLHTSMPGIIETFDPVKQLATIQPAIKRIFKTNDGDTEILTPSALPILINVPVQFPRGGGFSLTFPVKKGDECLLVFCERSIDNWHQFGGIKSPGARRFHSLSDATAFVGLSSLANKIPNYDNTNAQLKKDDNSVFITLNNDGSLDIHTDDDIRIDSSGDIVGTCENIDITANTKATVTAPNIDLTGDVLITGKLDVTGILTAPTGNITTVNAITLAASSSLTVSGKEMGEHIHPQANDSGGDTQVNTGVPV